MRSARWEHLDIFHEARALSMSIRNRRVRTVIAIPMMPLISINSSVETSSGTGLRLLERVLVKKRSDLAVHGPDPKNQFPLCKVFLVVSYLAVGWFYCALPYLPASAFGPQPTGPAQGPLNLNVWVVPCPTFRPQPSGLSPRVQPKGLLT